MAIKAPAVPTVYLWGGAAVLLGLYLLTREGVAQAIARSAAGAVGGAAVGAVKGAAEVVGIPDTDADQCTIDLANGDAWAASFSCPAPRFLSWAVGKPDFEAEKLKFQRNG